MKSRYYKATIDKLDKNLNGYMYRINIFKIDLLRCQSFYSYSTYAETYGDALTLKNYYESLER